MIRLHAWIGVALLAVLATGCVGIRPPPYTTPVERTLLTTGYCACGECCGWRRNWLGRPVYASGPFKGQRKATGITASGSQARRGTIAADAMRYPFGTTLYIDGYGYGRVEDRGGGIKGDHVDLFFRSHDEALEWGRRYKQALIWFR